MPFIIIPISKAISWNQHFHFSAWKVSPFTKVGFQGDHGRCYVNGAAGISFLQTGVQKKDHFLMANLHRWKLRWNPNMNVWEEFSFWISRWFSGSSRYIGFLWCSCGDGSYPHCPFEFSTIGLVLMDQIRREYSWDGQYQSWFYRVEHFLQDHAGKLKKRKCGSLDFCDFDPFRMTKPFYTMRSSQLHGSIRRVSRWPTLALTIFLLTCPFVVLQVPVAPGSSPQLPPTGLKGRKPGCWQVSSEGRCRNSLGAISHGTCRASGYCEVCICGKQFKVHRLVAHAFLGPPPSEEAWQVNHIDGNGSNNQMDNLEWVSQSENTLHSYATNPSRGNAGSKRIRPVMMRPMRSCNWTSFSSIKLAADALSQPYETVKNRCRRNSQVDGYEYKFAPVQQVEIPGEEWRSMIDPRSGTLVSGRMVSSQGRIKSKAGRISAGCSRGDGYLVTKIRFGSKFQQREEYVHRLVAAAFLGLPPSPDHSQINHKDGNKSNNAVDNLEYVTPAENNAHRSPLVQSSLEPQIWNQWRVDPPLFNGKRSRSFGASSR